MRMSWPREIALLLDSTCILPDANRIERMHERIERGIDWSELLRIAIPHGVLPLLSWNLAARAASAIPPANLVQLQLFGKRVSERNQAQSLALVNLVSALSRDGFRVLPFKGPALALAFYGSLGLRECHDLDLWIDPSQYALAREWLQGAGYRPVEHVRGVPRELHRSATKQEGFWSPDGKVLIEMRAHLEGSAGSLFDPPFEPVWNRRTCIAIHGVEMATIAVEDLLPGLAVHGSKHMWRRLNWIVDIAAVLSCRPEPDWEAVLSRAADWRCRRRLAIAVALAAAFYQTEIPAAIRPAVRDPAVCSAVAHLRAAFFDPKFHTFGGFGRDYIYALRSSDTIRERLRCTRHFLSRVAQADESQMMVPMSPEMRRVYGAVAAVRDWLGASGVKIS